MSDNDGDARDNSPRWSLDGHYFNADSLEALLETYADLDVGDVVFVGTPVAPPVEHYVSAKSIIEQLSEHARDDCGEAAEDWPSVDAEAVRELDRLLTDWITVERHMV